MKKPINGVRAAGHDGWRNWQHGRATEILKRIIQLRYWGISYQPDRDQEIELAMDGSYQTQTLEASCSIGYRGIKSERIHHWAEGLPSFYSFTSAENRRNENASSILRWEMKTGFVQAASNSIFSEKAPCDGAACKWSGGAAAGRGWSNLYPSCYSCILLHTVCHLPGYGMTKKIIIQNKWIQCSQLRL